MQRRRLLRNAGVIGGTLLAGCMGDSSEEFTLTKANAEIGQNASGYLTYNVTVSNVGNHDQTGKLYVTATLNDDELVRVREVSLEAHKTREISITYDVKFENVTKFTPKAEIRPLE